MGWIIGLLRAPFNGSAWRRAAATMLLLALHVLIASVAGLNVWVGAFVKIWSLDLTADIVFSLGCGGTAALLVALALRTDLKHGYILAIGILCHAAVYAVSCDLSGIAEDDGSREPFYLAMRVGWPGLLVASILPVGYASRVKGWARRA